MGTWKSRSTTQLHHCEPILTIFLLDVSGAGARGELEINTNQKKNCLVFFHFLFLLFCLSHSEQCLNLLKSTFLL